ncbi:uncharacterized protein LOC119459709 [Dermacentor silvarum]|uniref:uncharacterized protein LOC119459709 n=1 Tax=Dermacentor silvarum TaxID=543639 RepID=UPI0021007E03|nr:uncharacterized protein LOC119459709 [Dermacentor silvarum]
MEDQKMHGMIVAVGIGLAVLVAFITFTLFTSPPHQPRHKPPPVPAAREYTIRDHSQKHEVPAERRHAKKPSPEEDDDEEKRRKKVRFASQKAFPMNDNNQSTFLIYRALIEEAQEKQERGPQMGAVHAEASQAKKPNTEGDHKSVEALKNIQLAAQMVVPNMEASQAKKPNTEGDHKSVDALKNVQVAAQMVVPKMEASQAKKPNTEGDHKSVEALKNVQVAAQMVVPKMEPRKQDRTPPPRRNEKILGKRFQPLQPNVGVHAKVTELEPIDTLPAHPVVCIVSSSATAEVSYPQDGLCDAVIFNKVFYHSGVVSVSQAENHTYMEFLAEAAKSKLTAYMVATDRYFAVYETIPAAPSLEALRKENVRGFGFLGIRVQSAQGDMLEQHTRLLRSQVEDLNNMLKEVEVTDCAVFLGVTTEEHMFKDEIVTAAFKSLVKSVKVHLLIIENNQLKHDDCLASPITTWSNVSGIAFDEAQATAAWMTESGMVPALSHTAVAFSSWIPAMQFLRSADTTMPTANGTRRCFVFSLIPYDKMMCSHPRRYHNVSDMYFAKDESMQGVYVYEDPEILKEKVMKVRRAMSGTTANVGWAFHGLEYEGDDAGECGRRYDRIPAVKTALRSLRTLRVT